MPSNNAWRKAHPDIEMTDEGLSPFDGNFPSLVAGDFCVYHEAKGDKETAEFVKLLNREMVWAYDNWTKAQHDSNSGALMTDLLNGATKSDYAFVRRYLTDYCKANNLHPETQEVVQGLDYAVLAAEVAVKK